MKQNVDHVIATNQSSDRGGPGRRGVRPTREWYFVCAQCEAKWFSPKQQTVCPRCQAESTSNERLLPPWRQCRFVEPPGPIEVESQRTPSDG